jgi:uridine kinase
MLSRARVVGVSGGSGSGKTTIVRNIAELVPDFSVLYQDSYYRDGVGADNETIANFDFDHPDAIDWALMVEHIRKLRELRPVETPVYDFVHHRRLPETAKVPPSRLIIVDGILLFHEKALRDLFDLKIFVDTPDDIRFIRRMRRDITERGRTMESVIAQYLGSVRPGHFEFVEPSKRFADIIIPEGGSNEAALSVLASFVKETLGSR